MRDVPYLHSEVQLNHYIFVLIVELRFSDEIRVRAIEPTELRFVQFSDPDDDHNWDGNYWTRAKLFGSHFGHNYL